MGRVLVVEDEPNIGRIIEFKLTREGHDVTWLAQGADATRAADEIGPAVVLLDSTLDDVDFIDLLRRLSGCRVIVMTEHADADSGQRALAAGAVALIEKPFKPTLLARKVNELIRADVAGVTSP